jgi:hypothetical protein
MTAAARLLRVELRHNAMALMLPVVIVLFWFTAYRRTVAMPPLWNVRAAGLQMYSVIGFVAPLAGAAAWMGSRESRRRLTDMMTITPRARWGRLLATWAATTIWALVAYLGCVAVVYGITARQAAWGGPLWWPVAVAAASMPAFTALGFVAGVFAPSRFTAPLAAIGAFFILVLSTELITGSRSYWQVTPIVTGPWDGGQDPGVATFYHFLPDLPIAQVMFLTGFTVALLGALALPAGSGGRSLRAAAAGLTAAGLVAAGTAAWLAGTSSLDPHGMIAIAALHDAASDQPIPFTPVCSHPAIAVCLNPAYASYLSATTAALEPVLDEIAGLPGAPVQIRQQGVTYRQASGNTEFVKPADSRPSGTQLVYYLVFPYQLAGPATTASEIGSTDGAVIVADFTGDEPGASPAQAAVADALMMATGRHLAPIDPMMGSGNGPYPNQLPGVTRDTPAFAATFAAAQRFAALPASVRHTWLVDHLDALRAGQITLARLP